MIKSNLDSKLAVFGVLALSLTVGCGQTTIAQVGPKKVDAQTVALRKALPVVDKTQLEVVTDATNELSLAVLKSVVDENPDGNTVLSPLSLAQDFALLYESANGASKDQIAKLLKVNDQSKDALASFHSALLTDIESDPNQTLSLANGIWLHPIYKVDPICSQKLEAVFGCSVHPLPSDLDKAKAEMSAWVSKNTHGMIKEIKTKLESEIVAMFLNALYFDGKWKTEFDPKNTEVKPFHAPKGTVKVPMMNMSQTASRACFDADQPGIQLPFLGDRYSFVAIVPPNPKSFKNLVSGLSGKWFADYLSKMHSAEPILDLPKLDLSTEVSLKQTIIGLGGGALFKPPLDLSVLITNPNALEGKLRILSVIQQAKLKLDEKGVKAAAVTEIAVKTESAPMEPQRITFDKPFLYFIVHKASGAIVLCGIVNDPTKS